MAVVGYFPATLAVDSNTGTRLRNAEAQVFAMTDASFTTPLAITDVAGVPFTGSKLTSNSDGIYPEFKPPAGVTQVIVKSGQALTPMTSIAVAAEAAEAAAASATTAATLAGNAKTDAVQAKNDAVAARQAAEAVGATTDAQIEGRIKDPASKTAVALNATFGAAAVAASPEVGARIASATAKLQPYPMDGSWPIFERINGGAPVFTQATQNPEGNALTPTTAESIYWPWIIDARKIIGASALDEFYMYYSTDHAAHANSGIWLATGPTELGPWTGRGRVYRDDFAGAQTETPTVFPDPLVAGGLIMLYQQQGVPGALGTQSTVYATSTNGIAWTRGGLAIDIPAVWPGDGHTGYARHCAIGGRHFAHGGAGGGDYPTFALSESADGRKWRMQADPLLYNMDLTGDGRRIEWNTTDILVWQGNLWWVGFVSNFVSGSTPKDARLAVAPISADLRTLLAPPKYVLYPTQGAETTNYRSTRAFVARDGRIIFYYQSGNSFYAASTEV